VLAADDFGIRAAAIAAGGPAVALHARDRGGSDAGLALTARRLLSLARPPEAAVFVSGRADIAAAVGGHGVQLGASDLMPADARRVFPAGWIGRSVHTVEDARAAVAEGADFLVVGSIYRTASHPDREPAGPELVTRAARLGVPVIAIGGVTSERVSELAGGEMTELEIMVNGEPRRLAAPATASDLLHHLGLDPRTVVVEVNRKIVRRPQLGDTPLSHGDAVELVHFVGGG
jgi:thiamine biosynthesis protein ThiS